MALFGVFFIGVAFAYPEVWYAPAIVGALLLAGALPWARWRTRIRRKK